MPSEIPTSTSLRVPPSRQASETPRCSAASAHIPISTAALAIRCPRKLCCRAGKTSAGLAKERPSTRGATQSRDGEPGGVDGLPAVVRLLRRHALATRPWRPSASSSSSSRMRRLVWVPEEIRNGSLQRELDLAQREALERSGLADPWPVDSRLYTLASTMDLRRRPRKSADLFRSGP